MHTDIVSTPQSRTQCALTARIAELISKGYTARAAERVAKRERKASHPLHKRAIQRKVEAATMRFEAVGVFAL